MGVIEERRWWNALSDKAIEHNAWGNPPYDIVAVARLLDDAFGCLSGDETVLDLGCGPGRTMAALSSLSGCRTIGIDVSTTMTRAAVADGLEVQVSDGRLLPASLPSFDHAYSITVFEHIPQEATRGYMRQVFNALPSGGRFVFTHTPGDDPPKFLHYQCGPPLRPLTWANMVGFDVEMLNQPPGVARAGAWTWYLAVKP